MTKIEKLKYGMDRVGTLFRKGIKTKMKRKTMVFFDRDIYRFSKGKLLKISPPDVEADMVICLFESDGNPVIYGNSVFFVVKKIFIDNDGFLGFELKLD